MDGPFVAVCGFLPVDDDWTWSVRDGWAGFLYGVSGTGTVDGDEFGEGDVLPVREARRVEARSGDTGEFRLVAVSGRPHGEPIEQRGPYVL